MEEKFGTSFADIEVHVGTPEAKLGLGMMQAEAATRGRKMAFAAESPSKETVAHELTHIVQNKQGGVANEQGQGAASLSSPAQATEKEATRVGGTAASSDVPVDVAQRGAADTIHRSLFGGIIGGILGAVGGAVIGGLLGGPIGASSAPSSVGSRARSSAMQ